MKSLTKISSTLFLLALTSAGSSFESATDQVLREGPRRALQSRPVREVPAKSPAEGASNGAQDGATDGATDGAVKPSTETTGRRQYTVWLGRQRIFARPSGFSKRSFVERGTVLDVIGRRDRWFEVSYSTKATGPIGARGARASHVARGWTTLPPERRSAGELAEALGTRPGTSTVALVLKALDSYPERLAAKAPERAARLEALEESTLEVSELESFVKEGGLTPPPGGLR